MDENPEEEEEEEWHGGMWTTWVGWDVVEDVLLFGVWGLELVACRCLGSLSRSLYLPEPRVSAGSGDAVIIVVVFMQCMV